MNMMRTLCLVHHRFKFSCDTYDELLFYQMIRTEAKLTPTGPPLSLSLPLPLGGGSSFC
jgi:hypothetical protein